MNSILNRCMHFLDHLRVYFLKIFLKSNFLRKIYHQRSLRLMLLFLIACAIYLPLSLLAPVWVAVVGPIIWGVPHLFSSMRYVGQSKKESHYNFIFIIWSLVMALRVGESLGFFNSIPVVFNLEVEWISFIVMIFYLVYISVEKSYSNVKTMFLVILFTGLLYIVPIETYAYLLLAHNFVAFYYWYTQSSTEKDKKVAIFSTLIFSFITICILTGQFSYLYHWFKPIFEIPALQFDYTTVGSQLVPWSNNGNLWWRFFVAYAFGQAIHYFVWMKAIPEQHLKMQNPVSFKQSLIYLRNEFGNFKLQLVLIFWISSLSIWILFPYIEARSIYIAIASFHGFHEIAGLFYSKKSVLND